MIRFENVAKVYDDTSAAALESVNLEIERGEFVYLVGASGSGKSTFLQLVLREHKATSGRVLVAGKDVAQLSSWKVPHLRRQMGAVFQDFRLLPNKTVFENVAFALEVLGRSRAVIVQTVPQTLEMVGLQGKERRLPHELSGGEQQRVAIARAFVNRPAILLADEPTGNLDPTTSRGIMRVLGRINDTGTTIVMATHDMVLVDEVRRRVVELDEGRVIRDEAGGAYVTTSIPVIRIDDDPPSGLDATLLTATVAEPSGPASSEPSETVVLGVLEPSDPGVLDGPAPSKPEPSKPEPSKPELSKPEPGKSELIKSEPDKSQTSKPETSTPEQPATEAVQASKPPRPRGIFARRNH